MNDTLKKILCFFALCAYALGAIGGFGWAVANKGYLIGACVIGLAIMAFPTAKRIFKIWTGQAS